ncbi:MAG TPA: hypothetical protein VFE24_12235 [Pirellulales bacterium]|jgi:hypothetical protein|nr:hypothetical protein [Pirellulales bacterium]
MNLRPFEIIVQAKPAAALAAYAKPGPIIQIDGHTFRPIELAAQQLETALPVSFEEAGAALAELPQLYLEPDGSFVQVSAAGEPSWQVEGNLYDCAGRLLYVELKGTCPAAALDRLLAAFGWPAVSLVFQLVRTGIFLDELEFRRWARIQCGPPA